MANWMLVGLAAITFLNRYAFLSHAFSHTPGPKLRRFLSYSSFAVLTAIWVPLLLSYDGTNGLNLAGVDYLCGTLIAAGLTVAKFRSIVVVVASTVVFFLLRFWLL